jgi:hypothetical protein
VLCVYSYRDMFPCRHRFGISPTLVRNPEVQQGPHGRGKTTLATERRIRVATSPTPLFGATPTYTVFSTPANRNEVEALPLSAHLNISTPENI